MPKSSELAYTHFMKTTVVISDPLLKRARRFAKRHGTTLRGLIEDGLVRVLADARPREPYELPDRSVGRAGADYPLAGKSWDEVRTLIYGPESRSTRTWAVDG